MAEFGRAFGCTAQSRQYIIILVLIIHFFKTYDVPKVFKVHTQAMWKADFEWVTQFWCVCDMDHSCDGTVTWQRLLTPTLSTVKHV